MEIQERLTAFAMLGAGWVMWLLVGLSIVGVAIMLERAYFLLSSRDDVEGIREQLRQRLRTRDIDAARAGLAQSGCFEARIAGAALFAPNEGAEAARERLVGESRLARVSMERNLAFLGTVGNNAPFVGLLGTVIGIIRSFHALNESAGQVTAGLMSEVGEALVATAIGILVALPCVAAYNFFQRVIKTRLARGEALGSDVLAYLEALPHATASQGEAAE